MMLNLPSPLLSTSNISVNMQSMNANNGLLALPTELLLKICSYMPFHHSLLLSGSCRELHSFYHDMVIKKTRKYVLKDQGEIGSLLFILSKSEVLECVVLDCRSRSLNEESTAATRETCLHDYHLAYLIKKDRSRLHSIVLKGCSLLTNIGFLYIANSCRHLTALGKYLTTKYNLSL